MRYHKQYSKDLTHLTTIRLSPDLRNEAEKYADYYGISFSDFVRQSINRNINVASGIEAEVIKQSLERAMGKRI